VWNTYGTGSVMPGTAVAPGVRLIALPLPIALRIINAYLVEGPDGWALVDTGLHTEEAEQALRSALAASGIELGAVSRVFVTHVHPDHIGMAGTLARAGAEVVMHGPEAAHARRLWGGTNELIDVAANWFAGHGMPREVDDQMREAWIGMGRRVDSLPPIAHAADGDRIDLAGRRIRVVWTPGHTDHHACLFDEEDGTLYGGDHVLPHITSNISLYPWSRDDPLSDFLDALRAVRRLPVKRVLPAHGDPFDDLAARVDELIAHHEDRLTRVLELSRGRERDAYTICRDLFPVLRSAHEERFALAETLAHLRYLERRHKVREIPGATARWVALG
jgi:glyoxylase-like metal-dependent hydrolase (beta-lactamase superfamily II)